MLCCFAACGTSSLQEEIGLMKEEVCLKILQKSLLPEGWTFGWSWVSHQDNDPKHTSKAVGENG